MNRPQSVMPVCDKTMKYPRVRRPCRFALATRRVKARSIVSVMAGEPDLILDCPPRPEPTGPGVDTPACLERARALTATGAT